MSYVCSKCLFEQNEDQFCTNRRANGRSYRASWCNKCKAHLEQQRRRASGIKQRTIHFINEASKSCGECATIQPLSSFYKASRSIGGVSSRCKTCTRNLTDKARQREATQRYRKDNPHARTLNRIHQFNRRARIKAQTDGTVTPEVSREVYADPICQYCLGITPPQARTADHKIPLSRGGLHSAKNLVMACQPCNSSKQSLTDQEFIKRTS